MKREHYIGDEIVEALRYINQENDDWELGMRHPEEVDFTVEYHGGNYIHVEVNE